MSNPTTRSSRKRKRRERELFAMPVRLLADGQATGICDTCFREGCDERSLLVEKCSEKMPPVRTIYRGRRLARTAG